MKVGKSIVFDSKMGMRKFRSAALPFSKVACVVKGILINFVVNLPNSNRFINIIVVVNYLIKM